MHLLPHQPPPLPPHWCPPPHPPPSQLPLPPPLKEERRTALPLPLLPPAMSPSLLSGAVREPTTRFTIPPQWVHLQRLQPLLHLLLLLLASACLLLLLLLQGHPAHFYSPLHLLLPLPPAHHLPQSLPHPPPSLLLQALSVRPPPASGRTRPLQQVKEVGSQRPPAESPVTV